VFQKEIEHTCGHCQAEFTISYYEEDQEEPRYCPFCGEMVEEELYIDGDESDDE
jgi:rubrerythrin